jgi:hypothetical protein
MKTKLINPAGIIVVSVIFVFIHFFSHCYVPRHKFENYAVPPRPDYALENSWAALPGKKDSADVVPPGMDLSDNQANARVDVFYVHPTLFLDNVGWNADIADERLNKSVDRYAIRNQASVFNGSCRVYAPRYRQATLGAFMDANGNGRKALDTAYNDVRASFEYYLAHYNNGRPLIIAGHSQGTYHARRLIAEFFDNDPAMREKLVAVYLLGGAASTNMYKTIVPCDSAKQTGCYVAWHTRKYGTDYRKRTKRNQGWPAFDNYDNYACVNPLTWRRDTLYAPASLNKGSLPSTFDRIDVGLHDAKISPREIIWTHYSGKVGYPPGPNFHVVDFNLFWMNIRENVAVRIEEYLSKIKSK